ncbi:MAG: YbaK/EbsC family protein [Alphaproteobacteria bacterium]|nr:YbaK/EbsC family protein [Alphaproteobacteria bacterium]
MRQAPQPAALRLQEIVGPKFKIVEFDETTKTASDAAAAIGCHVAQIAKSIIFRAAETGRAVLAIASGTNRVDEKKLSALVGQKIERADADFVSEQTGFAIGGVPPMGHATPSIVFIDRDLRNYKTLWAAGGTPNAVFEIGFDDLVALSGATVADIAKEN